MIEGIPDEIMSDNGPPISSKELNNFFTGLEHTTLSPNYPKSNGFIKRQVQTVKRLMEKAIAMGKSFQEALTGLRVKTLGDNFPSSRYFMGGV